MADVGRSTAAHALAGEPSNAAMLTRLEGWGAWVRAIDDPTPLVNALSPMWKGAIDRYRETVAPAPYNVEDAEAIEALMVATLSRRAHMVMLCRFAIGVPSRKAADLLGRAGWPCSHVTYLALVDETVADLARAA